MKRLAVLVACACGTPAPGDESTSTTGTTGTTGPDLPTTAISTTSTTGDDPPPQFDLPFPDFPDPACEQQELADECIDYCNKVGIGEPCGAPPPPQAPIPYLPFLFDCNCDDVNNVTLADLDDDGIDDIVANCNAFTPRIAVWFGASMRPLACPTLYATVGATGLAIADFDGDARLDIVTVAYGFETLSLFRGLGNRKFAPQSLVALVAWESESFLRLTPGDLDADGDIDLVARGFDVARPLLGDGAGSFSPGPFVTFPNAYGAIEVVDLDGDDRLDVVGRCMDALCISPGDGQGGFIAPPVELFTDEDSTIDLAVGELTGDSHLDLLLLRPDGLVLAPGLGPAQFGPRVIVGQSFAAQTLALADLDGDAIRDVVVHGADFPQFPDMATTTLLTGDPVQGYAVVAAFAHPYYPLAPTFGDFNGDGRTDLVFAQPVDATMGGGVLFLESAP
ncbi:VCBS repeat-containing protein [Nannocystis sp.]|uniref:FG-GAP repeat domain-containing protein n=1 Tax=Nannocystis sp. TaxID=1962667 RepID=UPI0025FB45E9|nr:VCBS repeat-containing protein [Nannocystis sp.]MBK7825014.1 VCBS repeat-containing protein [Nannocystis sp.]